MKTLCSRYALVAFVALALGVGLHAPAPVEALVVYQPINSGLGETYFPQEVTFDTDTGDPILPAPVFELNLVGDATPEFRVDFVYANSFTIEGVNVSNARAAGMTPHPYDSPPPGFDVLGHDEIIDLLGNPLAVPYINRLGMGDPINNATFTTMTPIEGFPLGGFAARGTAFGLFTLRFGEWFDPDSATAVIRGYCGFRYEDNGTHYGWVDIETGPDPNAPFGNKDLRYLKIYGYAHEDWPGAEILAGQTEGGVVPIPGSFLLLGSGLLGLGLLGWRRPRG